MCIQNPFQNIELAKSLREISLNYPEIKNIHHALYQNLENCLRGNQNFSDLWVDYSRGAGRLPKCAWVAIKHKKLANEEYNIAYIYPNTNHREQLENSEPANQIPYLVLALLGRARSLNNSSRCRSPKELRDCADKLRIEAKNIIRKNNNLFNNDFFSKLIDTNLNLNNGAGFCSCFEKVTALFIRYDFKDMPSNEILIDDLWKFTQLFIALVQQKDAICEIN